MPDLIVAGAGMAGLAAAAQARERGADVVVLEKGDRAGGSMLLSSGVIWRHRDYEQFRLECPAGDPVLQRRVFERLDGDLAWLESLGASVTERDTGNPATTGTRFDTRSLTDALVRAAGDVRLGEPLRELPGDGTPVILATGGFQADRALVREHITPEADALLLRAAPWSTGDGLRLGLGAGAQASTGLSEFYGRAMPAPPARVTEAEFVSLSQLYAHHATVTSATGEGHAASTWSEIDVVQWMARQPGARATFHVPQAALEARVRERRVADMVDAAERAGAPVRRARRRFRRGRGDRRDHDHDRRAAHRRARAGRARRLRLRRGRRRDRHRRLRQRPRRRARVRTHRRRRRARGPLTVEHAFGSTGGFTLGIEEELLLVDAETHALAPVSEQVLPAMTLSDGAQAAHEAFAAQVELRSPVASGVEEAVAALASARAAARSAGATLMGAGLHPRGALGDAELVHAERYRAVDAAMRGLIRRTPESALHVHVGMPDPETAIRAFNGLRSHLPLLQALAANSPWWFGIDSGMASARASLVRSYPGRGIPRALAGWDDYLETVETTTRAGDLPDYTFLWWDVRPHPRLGTVEVREMDAQAPLADVAAISALVHGLARAEAERPAQRPYPSAEAIAWSSFRAARDGLDATLAIDGAPVPVCEIARAAVEQVRPHARELGAEDALEGIERILREGGGATRQRAAHADGGLDAVCAALVDATAD